MDNGANVDPVVLRVRQFGNKGWVLFVWAVVGAICAGAAMVCVLDKSQQFGWMIIMAILVGFLYFLVWHFQVREKNFMRQRRGWLQTAIFNFLVHGFTIFVSAQHVFITEPEDPKWIPFWILVTTSVFALEELTRPIFDFGVLTFLLRLPLQLAFAIVGREFSWYYLIGALLMAFCTFWQPYYLAEFVRMIQERNRNGGRAVQPEAVAVRGIQVNIVPAVEIV